jgi:hypothetical protein
LLAVVPITLDHPPAALALLGIVFALGPARIVLTQTAPPRLVVALVATVRFAVVTAALLTVGLAVA